MRPTTTERFWSKVRKPEGDGCWLWTGAITRDGYGQFRDSVRRVVAHRFSWEAHFGAISVGLLVLHRCDNPPCVNPTHLFLGTQLDNIRDMDAKGRCVRARGRALPQTRLTEDQVREIRAGHARGETYRSLAARFSTSEGAVWGVVSRNNWKWVA